VKEQREGVIFPAPPVPGQANKLSFVYLQIDALWAAFRGSLSRDGKVNHQKNYCRHEQKIVTQSIKHLTQIEVAVRVAKILNLFILSIKDVT
jgi:hypothetical protein